MRLTSRSSALSVGWLLAAGSAHAAGAVPQMDPTWFGNQLVWLVISFGLLYGMVSALIVPVVGGVLRTRAATIADAIAKAEAFKQHADLSRDSMQARGASAREEVAALFAAAQADSSRATAAALATLNAELASHAALTEAALQKAIAEAQGQVHAAALDLAGAMVEKLLGQKIDAQRIVLATPRAS